MNPTSNLHPYRLDDDGDENENGASANAPESQFLERRLLEARTLLVSGPVTDKLASYCATRVLAMERMHPEKPITVFINSPGGSADSGFALYDLLRFVSCPVRTVVNGLCASAAVLVLLAGRKGLRFSLPGSRMLIHQPSTAGRGTASDLDITAREIIKLRERYNRIISESTGHSVEKVLEDARRDFWLTASEAVQYKLIDKVVTARKDLPES
jgi:ATP-dependent Clp protease protease subunit